MSALAEKPDTAIAQVHTRSHPIPIGRRSDHLGSAVQRNSAEAPERIRDDLGLNLALALIGDVRDHAPASGGPFNRQLVALASDHLQKSVSANWNVSTSLHIDATGTVRRN